MTACARLRLPNSGLIGTVMIVRASATSSVSSPDRSGPNRMAERSPAPWMAFAATSGVTTGLVMPRFLTVVA